MTWLEKLHEDPEWLYKFHLEYAESYLPSFKKFASCIDEFEIFTELGLKQRFECPEHGNCLLCEFNFLTDPEIYEKSISEVDENG